MTPLVAVTVVLLAVRLWAATVVGFGDSEALYACWAVHPQPAYLDHPGLVGIVARAIGEGASPSPGRAHAVTAIVASAFPWLVLATARAFGADRRRAVIAALVVALVPEIAVGLFALTPDLLLAPLWLGTLALAALGLRARPGTPAGASAFLGAGLLAGIAASAKVSGLLLVLALVVAYARVARSKHPEARAARTIWPWAGLAAGLVVVLPIAVYEARSGFPMLRHRLVETQHGAGVAFTNLGQLVGGQLVYLSPVLAWIAIRLARDLFRTRNDDARSTLLFACFAVPFVPLVLLCIWSPVAEPHWIAPALLALPLHAARIERAPLRPRVLTAGVAIAALFTLVAHAWVLVPASARLVPESADPKLDIASELYGWPTVVEATHEQMRLAATPYDPEGREVVVVGPHWTICAQLHAAMPGVRVGCATPVPDDFDRWLPRASWRAASEVLWVTDNRFAADGTDQLPLHVRTAEGRVRILRAGRTIRVFSLYLYSRRGSSELDRPLDAVRGDALAEAVQESRPEDEVRDAEVRPSGERHDRVAHPEDAGEDARDPSPAAAQHQAGGGGERAGDERDRQHQRRAPVIAREGDAARQQADELDDTRERRGPRGEESVTTCVVHGPRACIAQATVRRAMDALGLGYSATFSADATRGGIAARPASRMSARSSSSPGFGVVSSVSP